MVKPDDPIYDPSAEKQRKHGAVGPEAVIERDADGKYVGRCAGSISTDIAEDLLRRAICVSVRRKTPPERYNVYEGVTYKAHGTKDGKSPQRYWGFPVIPSQVPPSVLAELRSRARAAGDEDKLDDWIARSREL